MYALQLFLYVCPANKGQHSCGGDTKFPVCCYFYYILYAHYLALINFYLKLQFSVKAWFHFPLDSLDSLQVWSRNSYTFSQSFSWENSLFLHGSSLLYVCSKSAGSLLEVLLKSAWSQLKVHLKIWARKMKIACSRQTCMDTGQRDRHCDRLLQLLLESN